MVKEKKSRLLLALGFMFPAYVFIVFGLIIPGVWNVILSFQEWDGFQKKSLSGFRTMLTHFRTAFLEKVFATLFLLR